MLKVLVTTDRGRLAGVQVTEHHETQGVGTRAIAALPDRMVERNTWDVDGVSGATVTSNALRAAVRDALGMDEDVPASPMDMTTAPPAESVSASRSGMGMVSSARVMPDRDADGNPVYAFNVVFAYGRFDGEGRVQELAVDQLEVATPNDSRSAVSQFSGFPGQGGYAWYDDAQGEIDGRTRGTEESFLGEVDAWRSHRHLDGKISMDAGSWRQQMEAYQRLFTGMTVEEIEGWISRCCSPDTGMPLRPDSGSEEDRARYAALQEADRAQLADVTSSATMSLRGEWGDIAGAIRMAWEDARRQP
jgi:hypothetical protein